MKNILILVAMLFALGSQAATLSCPSDTKTVLSCDAVKGTVIKSVVVCRDVKGNSALQIELNDKSRSDFVSVREIARTGATAYVGTDVSLSRQFVGGSINAKLSMSSDRGQISATLSCK